jgi:FkbM family methyltransferase
MVFDYFPFFKSCGFQPASVLDVGANAGDWTRGMKNLFPNANFFMVEGNDKSSSYLTRLNVPYEISLVGNYTGTAKYYKRKGDAIGTGNSRFRENTVHFTDAEEVQAPITTIDEIIERRKVGPFQLLKLDIQGGEVDAMNGARKMIESVEVLQAEGSFMAYNEGAPSFFQLYSLLYSLGFEFYGIQEILDNQGFPIQFDGIFVKRTSKLWSGECTKLKSSSPESQQSTDSSSSSSIPLTKKEKLMKVSGRQHVPPRTHARVPKFENGS